MQQESANLEEAFTHLRDSGALVEAAGIIVAARRRFIIGLGKSAGYAALIAADLQTSLSRVTLIDGASVRPVDVLAEVGDSDALVAFSFRRYREDTIRIVREFATAGGHVVLITDTEHNPAADSAEQVVVVPTASESYADSATAVAAASLILSTLVTASAKGARRRMETRSHIAERLGLYHHQEGHL
ncbi:MAG TPA: MurR/RpiR family transcriptional regulator [Pseudoclavibacter sp.]|nr:MurR/RpiR family transcriptional regulator [Pseudoclavibacter sp.]